MIVRTRQAFGTVSGQNRWQGDVGKKRRTYGEDQLPPYSSSRVDFHKDRTHYESPTKKPVAQRALKLDESTHDGVSKRVDAQRRHHETSRLR